jgi:YHS domain-containing protein
VSFGDREEIEMATAVDPVCGRELRRADAAAAVDHHGRVYFFCSEACRNQFLNDPTLFVDAAAAHG